mmetsp:Transcript_95267/g.307517  ORF Transcript_95267/g.307517 Transcript_95267/m.307517 type:complete len:282 (-) Transcript_95267:70-915(-)
MPARSAAVLLGLASAVGGAAGDALSLVQHSLQATARIDEAEQVVEQGVLGMFAGLVHAAKLDNFLRQQVLGEDNPTAPAATVPNEAPALNERQAPEPLIAAAPVAPVDKDAKCTAEERQHMNATQAAMTELLATKGPGMLAHVVPESCKTIAPLNMKNYGACLQQFLEVSEGCAECNLNFIQGLLGSDLFHMGCIPKCAPVLASCNDPKNPGRTCFASAGTCMQCAVPNWNTAARCVGLPHRESTLNTLNSFVTSLRSGDLAEPGALQAFFRKAAAEGESP